MSYMWIAVYGTLSAYDLFEKKNILHIYIYKECLE